MGAAGDPTGLSSNDIHVPQCGAHVFCRDVPAAEGLDVPAVGPEQLLGLVPFRVSDDDGLASAEVQTCGGGFVGHPPRQAQDIHQRLLLGGVGIEARPSERRAEGRGMDRNDRPEPGLIVGTEDHLLVAIPIDVLEHAHMGAISSACVGVNSFA
jgi:hypothetical protein